MRRIKPAKLATQSLIMILILISLPPALAASDWCIRDPANPPCSGAPGKCTRNSDGSYGGFVADTAEVEQEISWCGLRIRNRPYIGQYAQICENSRVFSYAHLYGNARVSGTAEISGLAYIAGNAEIFGEAFVSGMAQVSGNARVFGRAQVNEHARIFGDAWIYDQSKVHGRAVVSGNARIFGNMRISGTTVVHGVPRESLDRDSEDTEPDLEELVSQVESWVISQTHENSEPSHLSAAAPLPEISDVPNSVRQNPAISEALADVLDLDCTSPNP